MHLKMVHVANFVRCILPQVHYFYNTCLLNCMLAVKTLENIPQQRKHTEEMAQAVTLSKLALCLVGEIGGHLACPNGVGGERPPIAIEGSTALLAILALPAMATSGQSPPRPAEHPGRTAGDWDRGGEWGEGRPLARSPFLPQDPE